LVYEGGGLAMNKIKLKVQTLTHYKGDLPAYQSTLASGFDVRAQLSSSLTLKPGEKAMVPTGLSFEIPAGFEIQARPRSGLAAKSGITVLNTPGTIDADYRGEVKIILINLSQTDFLIQDQDRIAQLVVAPVWQAEFELSNNLSQTERGAGGFGSTGVSAK
jgi:dUTP pyrophosphatase